jgi:peptidoglycan hydrolase FlgJ
MSVSLPMPASAEAAFATAKQAGHRMPEVKSMEAAKEFEAVFLTEMFSHMFESVGVDPVFGGGSGERIYRSMMVQEYAKKMADSGGVGIADSLQKMMIQMQEKGG